MATSPSDSTSTHFKRSNNKNIEKHQLENILLLKLFLKVYINLILFYKKIYPENCFTSKLNSEQIFNLSIHLPIIRHPYVNEYIEKIIDSFVNDVLLVNFTYLLEDNNNELIVLNDTGDVSMIDRGKSINDIKFMLDLNEVYFETSNDIIKEHLNDRFVLDFATFPIDFYQNVKNQMIVSCFRENIVSLNTFLTLNPRINKSTDFLLNGKLKNDRFFKVKVYLPSQFTLTEASQFDWIYRNNDLKNNYKSKTQLKELEFAENITIYSYVERY
ncbi:hypothetical protein QEN19_004341 [Hanseniaspora menglaensis]